MQPSLRKGQITASYTDWYKNSSQAGADANKLADDVAERLLRQELPQSQNLGVARPDKAPEPYKNSAIQSDLPERASAIKLVQTK